MFRVLSGVLIYLFFDNKWCFNYFHIFICVFWVLVFTFIGASSLFSSLEVLILWIFLHENKNKKMINVLNSCIILYSANSF